MQYEVAGIQWKRTTDAGSVTVKLTQVLEVVPDGVRGKNVSDRDAEHGELKLKGESTVIGKGSLKRKMGAPSDEDKNGEETLTFVFDSEPHGGAWHNLYEMRGEVVAVRWTPSQRTMKMEPVEEDAA